MNKHVESLPVKHKQTNQVHSYLQQQVQNCTQLIASKTCNISYYQQAVKYMVDNNKCTQQQEQPRESFDNKSNKYSMEFELMQIAEMPQVVYTPLFFIDGIPFVVEISKHPKSDQTTSISVFLFCKSRAKSPYMCTKMSRQFEVWNCNTDCWDTLNSTVSTFKSCTSGFGAYDLFRKSFEDVVGFNSPYVNTRGSLRIRGSFAIVHE